MPNTLHAGSHRIDLSNPVCMGIINVTPDSFSDGSELRVEAGTETKTKAGAKAEEVESPADFAVDIDKALRRAKRMVEEGAAILDIGGESTRPGAAPVSEQEQMDRVLPVITAIRRELDGCISVDTSSAAVMAEAIAQGAELINDVRALREPGALEQAAASSAAVCLVHMQGTPDTMQDKPQYQDVVAEVQQFLEQRASACRTAGIAPQRIVLDPGFGFGKTAEHNFCLLKDLPRLQASGYPLLAGISRKAMIGAATGQAVNGRLSGSVAATVMALQGGAAIIRTHDVAATRDAIRVHSAFVSA